MRNKIRKEERGITLIALVITIIVLLILAGVTISMLSGENGILRQAAKAKTQTEKKSEEEAVKLAATAAMTNTNHQVEESVLVSELNSQLGTGKYSKNQTEDGWEIIVTKTGNHYAVGTNGEAKHLAWYYTEDGKQITNGKQTLTLGDTVNYNPIEGLTADANGVYKKYESPVAKNGYGSESQTFSIKNNDSQKLTWKVLGTDEDGNVLIMPTECIKKEDGTIQYLYLGKNSETDFIGGQAAAQYGAEEVNNVAEIYGHGKGAKGARAVQVEDIDKITGYNKTTTDQGNIYSYGNEVTYSCVETGKTNYRWINSLGETKTGTYAKGFTYLDGSTWKTLQPGQSTKLKSTYYYYDASDGTNYATNCKNINQNIYDLLFANTGADDDQYYWLSSSCVCTNTGFVGLGARTVWNYGVYNYYFFGSEGVSGDGDSGVRPAVSLKSDITFGGDATSGWTIQ